MESIPYIAIISEVAHYKQVVVSSWIVQALRFYSNKMKTEQSSSGGCKEPFVYSLGLKRCKKFVHMCTLHNYKKQ